MKTQALARLKELALDYDQVVERALENQLDPPVPSLRALKAIVPFLEQHKMSLEPGIDSLYHPTWRLAYAPLEFEIIVLDHFQSLGFDFTVGHSRPLEFNAICHGVYQKIRRLDYDSDPQVEESSRDCKIDFNWIDQ